MTRRTPPRRAWWPIVALTAGIGAAACGREPAFLTRTFEPGEQTASRGDASAELTRLTYGLDLLRATVRVRNGTDSVMRVDGTRVTVELEGLHYAAIDGASVEVPAGQTATLHVEVKLGRRLHVPARLILHGVPGGDAAGHAIALELPAAPQPDGDQSGTGP